MIARTDQTGRRRGFTLALLAGMVLAAALAACQSTPPPQSSRPEAAALGVAASAGSNCVACHTNAPALKQTASPPAAAKSAEQEGEG